MQSSSSENARRSGRAAAALIVGLAGLVAIGAGYIEFAFSSDPLGPRAFPYVLSAALAVFGLWYFFHPGEAETWPTRATLLQSLMLVAVVAIAVMAMPTVGFVISASVICAVVAWQFGATPLYAAVSGLVQGGFWFAIFKYALGTYLPVGALF
jgi:putative tricarboxylic transport membrane protein